MYFDSAGLCCYYSVVYDIYIHIPIIQLNKLCCHITKIKLKHESTLNGIWYVMHYNQATDIIWLYPIPDQIYTDRTDKVAWQSYMNW